MITKRCAFAAAAVLVVTGCTSESSTSGCGVASSGYTGTSASELGAGSFEYTDKLTGRTPKSPPAIAKGGTFSLAFKAYDAPTTPAEVTFRSASSERLAGVGNDRFNALAEGLVAVFAMSKTDSSQVVDLVHLKIVAPLAIEIASDFISDPGAVKDLAKGNVELIEHDRISFTGVFTGTGDDGEPLSLGGLSPTWTSSDEDVLSVEVDEEYGWVWLSARKMGRADITVTGAGITKVLHVDVMGYR